MKILESAAVARELVRAYVSYCLMPAYAHIERTELAELILNMWCIFRDKPLVQIPVTRSHIAAKIEGEEVRKRTPRTRTARRSASAAASGEGDPNTPKASGLGIEPEQAARA